MRRISGFSVAVFAAAVLSAIPCQAIAAEDPWSLVFSAGYFEPAVDNWEDNYDQAGGLALDLSTGYALTPRLSAVVEIGYFRASSQAKVGGQPTIESQRLTLIPTTIGLEYRLTFDQAQMLVPFVGAGFRHVSYRQSVGDTSDVTGGANGWAGRGGLDILLNGLDPSSASGLSENYGVTRSYFRLEAQWAKVDASGTDGSDIDLGGVTYLAGMRFEF